MFLSSCVAKLEFTDHCQRLLLEEKLSPKVTDEV